MQNNRLEHRLECVKKSRLLMDRINEAITVLRQKPKNGQKMYDIIFQTYIIPEKLTHDELLYRLDISDRHYYRAPPTGYQHPVHPPLGRTCRKSGCMAGGAGSA